VLPQHRLPWPPGDQRVRVADRRGGGSLPPRTRRAAVVHCVRITCLGLMPSTSSIAEETTFKCLRIPSHAADN
jgi:hypothetical protein